MKQVRVWIGLAAPLTALMSASCAAPEPANRGSQILTDDQGIPQITALYEQATARQVHRFRKPLRDRRERLLRQLATHCDRLLAQTHGPEEQAELTAAVSAPNGEAVNRSDALRTSLQDLRAAARRGDNRSMQRAHRAALAAYRAVQAGPTGNEP